MNKFRYLGIVAGADTFLTIFGYWAKITHQAYADKILTIGMWTLAISAAVYVYLKVSSLQGKN
ncbi:MAG: hypothetical protein ABI666_07500 [Ferruginibacter sp.]